MIPYTISAIFVRIFVHLYPVTIVKYTLKNNKFDRITHILGTSIIVLIFNSKCISNCWTDIFNNFK